MPAGVVDSNVVIAFASQRDRHHERANDIVRAVDGGDLPPVRVTNYVVAEVLNFVAERRRHDVAAELYDRIEEGAGFELVHAPERDYHRAVELFRQFDQLTFVDATLVAYTYREGLEYLYSFDDDFDVVDGVTRLDAAVDSFE